MAKKSRQKFTGQATANQPVVTDDDQDDGVTSIARMQCSGCGKYFVGTRVFDDHRTGDYGGPMYKGSKMISFKVSERRCLTDAQMRDKGMECEPRMVRFYRDGISAQEQHDVWFTVKNREDIRAYYQQKQGNDPAHRNASI